LTPAQIGVVIQIETNATGAYGFIIIWTHLKLHGANDMSFIQSIEVLRAYENNVKDFSRFLIMLKIILSFSGGSEKRLLDLLLVIQKKLMLSIIIH
jgi:hypothetical protein